MRMRKRVMALLLVLLISLTGAIHASALDEDAASHRVNSTTLAAGAPVLVQVPDFTVTLNNRVIDSAAEEYPFITYKDITYLPLTYYGCRLLGLEAKWTQETGLVISYGEAGEYVSTPLRSGSNRGALGANIAQLRIVLNGTEIDNQAEQYPFLVFRDVTYLPMTWKNMNTLLGCAYTFDADTGLSISAAQGNTIGFSVAPHVNGDYVLTFTLDRATLDNTDYIEGWCEEVDPVTGDILSLGASLDYVWMDWNTGVCEDDFDGKWFSLPDGQNLSVDWYEYDDDYHYYVAFVFLNGEEAQLLFKVGTDEYRTIDSSVQVCYDLDIDNAFDVPLGAEIIPYYYAWENGTDEEILYTGSSYIADENLKIYYNRLEAADYRFGFVICDYDGNTYTTEYATYYVDEDGGVTYIEN